MISEQVSPKSWNDFLPYFLIGVELFNFKSYRNKHIIGPFTDLTAIIGPNGSGKSNLMDAISFALFIKTEKLRIDNLTSLTDSFDGDNSISKCVYVKLVFKSKQNPTNKVYFQRSIIGEDCSSYLIDDNVVAENDYISGLNLLGFNVKNKMFLIFQNTIDRLLISNPKVFTNIIEELSGSFVYKERYRELKEKCLMKTTELNTLDKEKQNFYKSKKFIEFLKCSNDKKNSLLNEIEEQRVQLILVDFYHNQTSIEKYKEILSKNNLIAEETTQKLENLNSDKDRISLKLQKIKYEKATLENEIRNKEIHLLSKNKCQHQSVKEEFNEIENRLKNANIIRKRLLFQIEMSRKLIKTLQQEIDKQETEIQTLRIHRDLKRTSDIKHEMISEYKRLKNSFESEAASSKNAARLIECEINILKQKKHDIQFQRSNLETQLFTPTDLIIDNIDSDIEKYKQNLRELKQIMDEMNKELKEVSKEIEGLVKEFDSSADSIARKYVHTEIKAKKDKQEQFIRYLCDKYQQVKGRLHELCKPINNRFRLALSIVMSKYLNAIVVDSFQTVESIFKNESSYSISSETFLALDTIKAPTIKEHLRNVVTVSNVSLLYDLVQYDSSIEKAVRFVIGNTLLSDSREKAAKVAYELGDGKTYQVISIDGVYFSGNGQISSHFNRKFNDPWTGDDYLEDVAHLKSRQKAFAELLNNKNILLRKIHANESEFYECKMKLEELFRDKEECNTKYQKNKEIEIELERLERESKEIEFQIQTCLESYSDYQKHWKKIEERIFGSFLSKINLSDLKQFEIIYSELIDDSYLYECELKLENLKNKFQNEIEKCKNLEEDLKKWENVIEKENHHLKDIKKKIEHSRKLLDNDEQSFLNSKKMLDDCNEDYKSISIELQRFRKEIDDKYKILQSTNQSIVKSNSDLKNLFSERFQLLKRSFNEGLTLPFDCDPSLYKELWANVDNLDGEEIRRLLEEIVIDFDKFPNIKISDDSQYSKMKFDIENKILEKEEELQQLTLAAVPTSLSNREREIAKNLLSINKNITKTKIELDETRSQFEQIKLQRCELFNSYLEKVSVNLNQFYKELMQSEASQSYLIPENPEEPYLEGILYNCIVPGKLFRPVSCLSGGEKTLAMFAFIFSLYFEKIPSFFIMDEIDGCLDNANIFKLIEFLKSKSSFTQFILISQKPELFAQANSLIGICKEITNGLMTSKSLSLDISGYLD